MIPADSNGATSQNMNKAMTKRSSEWDYVQLTLSRARRLRCKLVEAPWALTLAASTGSARAGEKSRIT